MKKLIAALATFGRPDGIGFGRGPCGAPLHEGSRADRNGLQLDRILDFRRRWLCPVGYRPLGNRTRCPVPGL